MVNRTAGRKGHRYRLARQRVIEEETHCVICGGWVDKQLPGTNRRGPSAHHHPIPRIRLIAMGGDPNDRGTMRLAHLGCNAGLRDRVARRVLVVVGTRDC